MNDKIFPIVITLLTIVTCGAIITNGWRAGLWHDQETVMCTPTSKVVMQTHEHHQATRFCVFQYKSMMWVKIDCGDEGMIEMCRRQK